jgi:DNA-binding PadR family transcriptional regulator
MSDLHLQEPQLLLLTALAEAPRHGYGLIAEVAAISGGRVQLRTGSLYGALQRLVHDGLIRVEREEIVEGRARKVYALTEPGIQFVREQTARLRDLVGELERRVSPRSSARTRSTTA